MLLFTITALFRKLSKSAQTTLRCASLFINTKRARLRSGLRRFVDAALLTTSLHFPLLFSSFLFPTALAHTLRHPPTAAMPLPPLTIIHYTYPILLSLPLPFILTPVSPPSPPPPGLIPITVQGITPRRTLILTLLALLAFTSFLDVTVLVANVLSARVRYGDDLPLYLTGAQLGGEITYALGGLVAWGVALIACLWRNKFSKSLAVLASLGAAGEIVNLVWLVKREVHTGSFFMLPPPKPCKFFIY